jgi:hypothetical protein
VRRRWWRGAWLRLRTDYGRETAWIRVLSGLVADPLLQGVETKVSAGEDGEVRGRVTAKGRGRRRARPRQGRVGVVAAVARDLARRGSAETQEGGVGRR